MALLLRPDSMVLAWKETGRFSLVRALRLDHTGQPLSGPMTLAQSKQGDFYGLQFMDFPQGTRILTHFRDYTTDSSQVRGFALP